MRAELDRIGVVEVVTRDDLPFFKTFLLLNEFITFIVVDNFPFVF